MIAVAGLREDGLVFYFLTSSKGSSLRGFAMLGYRVSCAVMGVISEYGSVIFGIGWYLQLRVYYDRIAYYATLPMDVHLFRFLLHLLESMRQIDASYFGYVGLYLRPLMERLQGYLTSS